MLIPCSFLYFRSREGAVLGAEEVAGVLVQAVLHLAPGYLQSESQGVHHATVPGPEPR